MSEKIDVRVSPALDPETYRGIDGVSDETMPFVGEVINAFSSIYTAVGIAHDARRAAEGNPAWTPENRVLIVAKEIDGARQHAVSRLASAERTLRANIAHTTNLLSEPLAEQAGRGSINSEVRAHVAKLDRGPREAFMKEALDSNDEATLTAILGAQHFLSGLSKIDHEHFIRVYHERKNPALVRRLDVMNKFIEAIERNGPIVHQQFNKAIGAKPADVAGLKVRDDRAKAALAKLKA